MYDDIDNERDFWSDEPTRRLTRLPSRLVAQRDTTNGIRRPAGARQHLPVITTPAKPARRPLDPFLRRLGLMVCLGLAMLPLALSLRNGAEGFLRTAPTGGAAAVPNGEALSATATLPATTTATDAVAIEPAGETELESRATPAEAAVEMETSPTTALDVSALPPAVPVNEPDEAPAATTEPSTAPTQKATATTAVAAAAAPLPASPVTTAVVSTSPKAETPTSAASCTSSYKVVGGDYWIVIADKVGVSLKELLGTNNATVSTPLYPGRTICLPRGASAPTTAAPATAAPASTLPACSTATTAKPPTTAAPTTTLPSRTYTAAEVEGIIREVWPDDLEDEAVRIARRESNLQPAVRNACCFGLFQIYWNVHKGWLTAMGITSADQLFNPRTNATAGYALYQRSGGWGPWAL